MNEQFISSLRDLKRQALEDGRTVLAYLIGMAILEAQLGHEKNIWPCAMESGSERRSAPSQRRPM